MRKVEQAINKGVNVILKTQIKVDGELTAWYAQYDPKTLLPSGARSYELPSISGAESVEIVKFLMRIEHPDSTIIQAVNSSVKWFEKVKISGVRIIKKEMPNTERGYDLIIGFDPVHAQPLWARFYEIGTNYPMFLDRDGIVKYALSEIGYERRVGYRWLGSWANDLLEEAFPKWTETVGLLINE